MTRGGRAQLGWFVVSRLARVIGVVIAVCVAAWLLVEAAPGPPALRAARAAGVLPAEESGIAPEIRAQVIADVAAEYNLDRGLARRIIGQISDLVRGDLGRSWRDGARVNDRIGASATATLILVFGVLGLAGFLGAAAAVIAAMRPRGFGDLAVSAAAALAFAVPPVWLSLLALRALDPEPGASSYAVAIGVLAAVPIFFVARFGRAELLRRLGEPWALAARARGATSARIVAVYGLRTVLPALLPLLVSTVAYVLGAAVVIEQIFGIRGMGALLVDAASRQDAPVVVGVTVVSAGLIALTSAVVDMLGYLADPRRRDLDSSATRRPTSRVPISQKRGKNRA